MPIIRRSLGLAASLALVASSASAAAPSSYDVKSGDTLRGLAKQFYGDVSCWPLIASIPENHAYYPGPMWRGKIAVPSKETCDALHQPPAFEGATKVSTRVLGSVTTPLIVPHLLSTYVEGIYRNPEEQASISRIGTPDNVLQGNIGPGWHEPPYLSPAAVFRAVATAHPAVGYGERSWLARVLDQPLTKAEKENAAWWKKTLAPYVTDVEKPNASDFVRYLDGSHVGFLIADQASTRRSVVIDGKRFGPYDAADFLTLLPNGSWAFRYSSDGTAPKPATGWYIKTDKAEYGPLHNPTPPVMTADGHVWYFDWDFIAHPAKPIPFTLYRDGKEVGTYDWVDTLTYGKNAEHLVYRARQGNTWSVFTDGKQGMTLPEGAWDYVDQLQVNPETGSVFYRARDKAGKWYAVKDSGAVQLPWEPARLLLDAPLDLAIALRGSSGSNAFDYVEAYSSAGGWTFDAPVRPIAIDAKGHVLFEHADRAPIPTGDGHTVCDSCECGKTLAYWLDGKKIGSAVWNPLPLFTPKTKMQSRDRYVGSCALDYQYYGPAVSPAFDPQGRLATYVMDGSRLSRIVYDLSSVIRP